MSNYNKLDEDPCRSKATASGERALAFVLLFIAMFGFGGYAITNENLITELLAAALAYTAGVTIYGFARNRNGIPRYLFTCPVVVSQYPRLLKRHAAFLAVETGFLAIALRYFPLPPTGASRAEDGNDLLVAIPLGVLALAEIFTNRGILDRAHNIAFGEPPASDVSESDRPISILPRDQ